DWIRAYRAGGYEALVPKPRKVTPRTPARIIELALALKRERPNRTAAPLVVTTFGSRVRWRFRSSGSWGSSFALRGRVVTDEAANGANGRARAHA
ncbi:MAG: helix-turn-helix domain-containing protein, partial [Thermoleophilaceae bacterium]|nr:helix-turn-helix domain-containing protein [Thermoleophilaceae bacterium]